MSYFDMRCVGMGSVWLFINVRGALTHTCVIARVFVFMCRQDILFFWVARMAMVCTQLTNVPPFKVLVRLCSCYSVPLWLPWAMDCAP